MTKRRAKLMIWLNSIFIGANIYFMLEGSSAEIHLFAGLISLLGLIASYLLLKQVDEDHA